MTDTVPRQEKIVVGVSGVSADQDLVRRAAGLSAAVPGGELHVVNVRSATLAADQPGKEMERLRQLTRDAGGTFYAIGGQDVADSLLRFARSVDATQIVLGTSASRRHRGSVADRVRQQAGGLDVHLVSRETAPAQPDRRSSPQTLGRRRKTAGFILGAVLPPSLQFILDELPHDQLSTDMLVQMTGVVAVALVGGLWPAVATAALASLVVNYFSVLPVGSFEILDPENVLALVVFLLVAVAVSLVVDRSARLSKEARQAGAEAAILGEMSRRAVAEGNSIPAFLNQVRDHFQVDNAALWARNREAAGGTAGWTLLAHSGAAAPPSISAASTVDDLDAWRALALTGRELGVDERRLLAAFGAHLLAMLQREELSASQQENLRLAEGNKMRTSILRAVSHDLRTPLAGIKLAASSLRDPAITLPREEQQELLATIETGADRLDRLVSNLLDMSRITADSISPLIRPVYWADVVGEAVRGADPDRVRILLPDNMPPVEADPGLLERVIANLVENALKYAPESDVVIAGDVGGAGSAVIGGVPASELKVVDHGAGIPASQVLSMFRPFQRADDTSAGSGIGLGLAVAKGFTEAMGGVLVAEQTPGGGLTMVVRLPLSTGAAPTPVSGGHHG
ncbi:DUF4118 domain-containing protein [Arthrobacter sp. AD-310]